MQHIAELGRRSLGKILSGKRTVEPLFSKKPEVPVKGVAKEETVFLKSVDGFAIAKATIKRIEHYEDLQPQNVKELLDKYEDNIRPDELMKSKDIYYPYATLLWLENVQEIKPFRVVIPADITNPRWIRVEDVANVRGS